MSEHPDPTSLTAAQKDALIASLLGRIEELLVQNQELRAQVKELEGRLLKDSRNSSKPPSSDGPKRRPKSLRVITGAPVGGQVGHTGVRREPVAEPDEVIEHPAPSQCGQCGAALPVGEVGAQRRQVWDLPPLRLQVTEHRVREAQCACGHRSCGDFPAEVTQPMQYGPGVRAAGVYLVQQQLLPVARAAEVLSDLCGVPLSAGTVQAHVEEAGERLVPVVEQIAEAITAAPVAHFDETGQRVGKSLHWLHTACTPTLTWYGAHANRGREAMEHFKILPRFDGVAVHDGLTAYQDYACTHALCNAHHLRELTWLEETTGQLWPGQISALLRAAKKEQDALDDGSSAQPPVLPVERQQHYRERYAELLSAGERLHPRVARTAATPRGRIRQSAATNLLARLRTHSEAVLRFTTRTDVPFDNNPAERAIRMPKLKQKVSGGFRTPQGAQTFAVTRSYLATLRQQGRDVFQALTLTFQGQPPNPLGVT